MIFSLNSDHCELYEKVIDSALMRRRKRQQQPQMDADAKSTAESEWDKNDIIDFQDGKNE